MANFGAKHLNNVILSADVYAVCLQHALTTEKEEIMGLLIGEVDDMNVSHITACVILHRSDKQPDRVEISPEQLCTASTAAEQLTHKLKRPMSVRMVPLSHPHITVWPSHVEIAKLPRILAQEEVEKHDEENNECEDLLAELHNEAYKTLNLVHLISKVSRPLYEDLEARLNATNIRIRELEKVKKKLVEALIV
ncbi:eukaryotic translation initiation factor 3 -related [Holotrichia oblita]|uniref:Eukaryotic translation initiation factor 3 -related n=1 Tax=Holotrichia oblita TaxID=644536 RepID=A0ACB9T3U6_HOLOL|nr:eukaryotic translation initiation factor 3 -related [Holotrichia oblita]